MGTGDRTNPTAPVSKMPTIVEKYDATSQKTKDDLREALKGDAPAEPKPRAEGSK